MKILIAGDFRYNSGSSHVVFNYNHIAGQYGCQIKISAEYGSLGPNIGNYIPICTDATWADHLILVFEANQYLNHEQIEKIQRVFTRESITIVDPDGRYGPTIDARGDSNHSKHSAISWKELYDVLSDRILQPRLSPLPTGAQFFPYFGMENIQRMKTNTTNKIYTIQYIGSNWYRWESVIGFLSDLQSIRSQLGRIAFKGKWWDGTTKPGLEKYTYADVDFFQWLRVETEYSVPFGEVISAMSQALISPIFVRPMISAQKLITPRMFETLCADTIPIFGNNEQYIIDLYGYGADELCIKENAAEQVQNILRDPSSYFKQVEVIRERLFSKYSYPVLFSTLLNLIS